MKSSVDAAVVHAHAPHRSHRTVADRLRARVAHARAALRARVARTRAAVCAAALFAGAAGAAGAADAAGSAGTAPGMLPLAQAATPAASAASAAAPAPDSGLGGELFYQILLGELAVRQGEAAAGFQVLLEAARRNPRDELFERAVEVALQARNGDAALLGARTWTQALPQSREGNRYLLQILLALNRLDDAVEPLRKEVRLAPVTERPAVLAALPGFFARATDRRQAARVVTVALADAVADRSTAPEAWTAIGRMLLAAQDPTGALEAAGRGQTAGITSQAPAFLALELMSPQRPAAEQIVLRHLAARDSAEVRSVYARALMDDNRYGEAITQIQRVTQAYPDNAQAWLTQGTLLVQAQQAPAAEAALRRYLELAESSGPNAPSGDERTRGLAQAYLALAQLAERRRDFVQAEIWLNRIENSRELVAAQNRRASILARQGKLDEARAILRSLPIRGEGAERLRLSAEVNLLRENKQFQAAYDLLVQGLQRDPEDTDLVYDKAMMAEKLGRYDEMERLLRDLMARKPDHHHAYNALGYSLAERNQRLPEARELIVKALSFAPDDPYITDSLGWVEFRMGNLDEALRILERAYRTRPDSEIAAHLGEVLWALGQRERARVIWREGVLQDAENETLQETLRRLKVQL